MKPEERRTQIMDCAQGLFFQKGYDVTTIADIMQISGVSKGGFYHHFKSKEELIGGILQRFIAQSVTAYLPITQAEGLSAMERYLKFFDVLRGQQTPAAIASVMHVISALLKDENAVLRARISETLTAAVAPIFSKILQFGIDEGVFQIDDASTAAELIVRTGNYHQYALKLANDATSDAELKTAGAQITASLKMQGVAIDRLLGLADGTTVLRAADFADDFVSFVRTEKGADWAGSGATSS